MKKIKLQYNKRVEEEFRTEDDAIIIKQLLIATSKEHLSNFKVIAEE